MAGHNIMIDEQYRKIIFIDWKEEASFKAHGIPHDSKVCRTGMLHHDSYKELAVYALENLTADDVYANAKDSCGNTVEKWKIKSWNCSCRV